MIDPTVAAQGLMSTVSATTTTGSITPVGGLLLVVAARHTTTGFTDTTAINNNTLTNVTWTKVGTIRRNSDQEILTVFEGTWSTTPSAGTVNIVMSQATSSGRYTVYTIDDDIPHTSSFTSSFVSNSGSGTTGSLTQTQSTTYNWQFAFYAHMTAESTTPKSTEGWSELGDTTTTSLGYEGQWQKGSDPGPSATWATSSGWLAAGVLLKPATSSCLDVTNPRAINPDGYNTTFNDDEATVSENPVGGHNNAVQFGGGDEESESGTQMGMWAIVGGPNP